MSVYRQRRRVNEELLRTLGDQYVVVAAPDHPLLMKGPDILIGGNGALSALLIPTASERRQPKLATARFALCRLALPEQAKFLLLAGEEDGDVATLLSDDVAAVFSIESVGQRRELATVVSAPQRLFQHAVPEKLRDEVNYRFGQTYRVARAVRRPRRTSPTADWPTRGEYGHRNPIHLRMPAQIASLTLKGADESFSVDNGVPYPTGRLPNAAVIDRLPDYPGDPQKYMRAAAFSGWVLSEMDSPYLAEGMKTLERRVFQ